MFRRRIFHSILCLIALAGLAPHVLFAVELQYEPVSSRGGVVDIRNAADGSGRLFLVEQAGRIWVVEDGVEHPSPFLDLRGQVRFAGERGLLSLAFSPDYAQSGRFYAWYTNTESDMVLSRFRVSPIDPNQGDVGSEEILLTVTQPRSNHNGGRLAFGPDGYLYLSIGDGGGAGDPDANGQNPQTLLGTVIRIDVDPSHGTYAVPPDNPFVGGAGRDEIWAWGLRNPWRIAFDPLTGELFIADVGQGDYEEINVQPALDGGGRNYGWNLMEGFDCYQPGCDTTGLTLPVGGYGHDLGCSVTGGEVYRGNAYPDLRGVYLFGDYCSGRIWGLGRAGDEWVQEPLDDTDLRILTFGTGEDGAVYLSAANQGVFRLSDGPPVPEPPFRVNAGLNDAWFEPATRGQGMFINVLPDRGQLFLAWFTFDSQRPADDAPALVGAPGQRWLTALGPLRGNRAELTVSLTEGGTFDSPLPVPATSEAGRIVVAFSSCDQGMLTYQFPALERSGQIPIRRVVGDNVALCEALSEP